MKLKKNFYWSCNIIRRKESNIGCGYRILWNKATKRYNTLGRVLCFKVIRDNLVLFWDQKGGLCEYNPLTNKTGYKIKVHIDKIRCIIENEDNNLIGCSADRT